MKKSRIVLVILSYWMIFGTMYAQSPQNLDEKKEDETWVSMIDSICAISYPNTWNLDKSGEMGALFFLFSPLSSASDTFSDNINLIVQDISGYGLSLQDYVQITETQIPKMITDGKIVLSEPIKRGEQLYHKMVYTGKENDYSLTFMQYFCLINGKAFVLTYTAEANEFENTLEIATKIMDSFVLKQK